ncbi:hypothetical protein DL239_00250 [Sedimentitalea sp. CY04]|uniref:Uncharacterized protein n=1 Tax=Parasedimentitalea denitrificans TaxID=2211118 RepID=A0ABX0W364_9RHOB|nr:hypothetical protein [Sedimentitalea sp. CY04]NIZ59398.1 hypothetical protein [Sedimentitalea sp. CY04]
MAKTIISLLLCFVLGLGILVGGNVLIDQIGYAPENEQILRLIPKGLAFVVVIGLSWFLSRRRKRGE